MLKFLPPRPTSWLFYVVAAPLAMSTASMVAAVQDSQGSLVPERIEAGAIADYELRFSPGAEGLGRGEVLSVDFPKAWFAEPFPFVKDVQIEDPTAPHYASIQLISSRGKEKRLRGQLSIDRRSRRGEMERFRHRLRLELDGGRVRPDDTFVVRFANTTAPVVAGQDVIVVSKRVPGEGDGPRIVAEIEYEVAPAALAKVRVVAPSEALVGRESRLTVVLFDALDNPITSLRRAVSLSVAGVTSSPLTVDLAQGEPGLVELSFRPRRPSVAVPVATAQTVGDSAPGSAASARGEGATLTAIGGPIRVLHRKRPLQVYWGDLHSHSRISKDGIGAGDFAYARDVSGLDFFASTEHSGDDGPLFGEGLGPGIAPEEWSQIQERVRDFNEPGEFVTLLGYECSLRDGHHNVYFRGLDGRPIPEFEAGTIEGLWDLLEEGQALTVPHHLGIQWAHRPAAPGRPGLRTMPKMVPLDTVVGGPAIDWQGADANALRPALEIYSGHGQSEFFAPEDLLAHEQVAWTSSRSADGPHYARDAWAAGKILGVVGGSDNHQAQPGLPSFGLTAVLAPELSREAVFDAIAARRTYATTGTRLLMDFKLEDVQMGGEAAVSTRKVRGRAEVFSPSKMRYAEVVGVDERGEWTTVVRWDELDLELQQNFDFRRPEEWGAYYLRVELEDELDGRPVRGWTSPVWIRRSR